MEENVNFKYQLTALRQRNVIIFTVAGELTSLNSSDFYEDVRSNHPLHYDGVVIDLARVNYLDSTGLGACVRIFMELSRVEKRGALVIKDDGTMDSLIAFANMVRICPVFKSRSEAVRYLSNTSSIFQGTHVSIS